MKSAEELAQWVTMPFASAAERIAAYADPQYHDPYNGTYREAVALKESITSDEPGMGSNIRVGKVSQPVYIDVEAAAHATEASKQQEEQRLADEATLAQQNGPLSIRPTQK